jgi:hypothetical protein
MAALALAQLMNCLSSIDQAARRLRDMCDVQRIARGVHADVLLVEPGIRTSKSIRFARRSTVPIVPEGRRRVVIVDDRMLNLEAFERS